MASKNLFSIKSPLGYRVVLTRNRWREIVRFKHPAVAGMEKAVRECIKQPDIVRASSKNQDVHLYYRNVGTNHVCVVVGGEDADERFVITVYLTKRPKKGNDLWTK